MAESEIFELEEAGEDDLYSETFSVKIPKNTEKGEYELIIRVVFDGDDNEERKTISVLEKAPIEMETIYLQKEIPVEKETIFLEDKKPLKIEEKKLPVKTSIPQFVPLLLFVGIIILILLIIIIAIRKRNF